MREWELVNENIKAFIYRGEGHDEKDSKIDGVLSLSYEELPYYLKSCFLYMGIFKEDESIYADHLYGLWIAQGMISNEHIRGKERDETLTDIAEFYLNELASRSLVQVEVDDLIPTRKYWIFKLHDVIRELCLKMGRKEDFGLQILEYEGWKFSTLFQEASLNIRIRHLAIFFKRELQVECDDITVTEAEDTSKYIRSLRIQNHENFHAIEFPQHGMVDFHKFKFLRDLVIKRFKFAGRKLPKGITNLVLLKCLRLQECELDELPPSIRNLVYLDTLDLSNSKNVRVPNVLKKLLRLKHLVFPYYNKEAKYQLRLDEGIDELENLIGYNSLVHQLKSVTGMKNLRRFTSEVYDNESLLAIVNAIATKWNKLHYCMVDIKEGCSLTSDEGLMNLKQLFTCPSLCYLGVFVKLGKLPVNSNFTNSKLVILSLKYCKMEDDPMGILGKLPCLIELHLHMESFDGEKMTCRTSSFPSLKRLILDRLPKLREWKVEEGAMVLLCEIHIHNCPNLQMLPDGLSYISTLQRVIVSEMPELRKRVLASGKGFHKIRHVPSIIIHESYAFYFDYEF